MRSRAAGRLCLTILGLAGSRPAGSAADPAVHVVIIENMQFSPQRLEVRVGERVAWINKDFFAHTATAGNSGFDSGSIGPGATWSYVPGRPGEYAYQCTLHHGMTGMLVIIK